MMQKPKNICQDIICIGLSAFAMQENSLNFPNQNRQHLKWRYQWTSMIQQTHQCVDISISIFAISDKSLVVYNKLLEVLKI